MENGAVQHITKTPGICGGRPCIAGHRIRVQDVVVLHDMRGLAPAEIIDQFPGITIADVYAALAYYHNNRQEIEEEFRKEDQWEEWVKTNIGSKIPTSVREHFGG